MHLRVAYTPITDLHFDSDILPIPLIRVKKRKICPEFGLWGETKHQKSEIQIGSANGLPISVLNFDIAGSPNYSENSVLQKLAPRICRISQSAQRPSAKSTLEVTFDPRMSLKSRLKFRSPSSNFCKGWKMRHLASSFATMDFTELWFRNDAIAYMWNLEKYIKSGQWLTYLLQKLGLHNCPPLEKQAMTICSIFNKSCALLDLEIWPFDRELSIIHFTWLTAKNNSPHSAHFCWQSVVIWQSH